MQTFKEILDLEALNKVGRAQEIDHEKEGKLLREITSNIKRTMVSINLIFIS